MRPWIIFRHLTKRSLFFLAAELVVMAALVIVELTSKDSRALLFATATLFILLVTEQFIEAHEERKAKREQLAWVQQVKALTDDVLLPSGCSLEDLPRLLKAEEKQCLLETLAQRPHGQRNLKQALDSIFPRGFF